MRKYRIIEVAPYTVAIAFGCLACAWEPPSSDADGIADELLLQPLDEEPLFHESRALALRRPFVLGRRGWQVQSSSLATQSGDAISRAGFATHDWLSVRPDDAGAPGTVINALLQNGECPDVFFSDNMRTCFSYMAQRGPVTVARFAVPWWFRTEFELPRTHGKRARLTIPGVVGEGDVWLNGARIASRELVSGAFASHTFDVTELVHEGGNALAIAMYPNDPTSMFTLDNVDWTQIPPDNQTGIQFPIRLQLTAALHGSNAHVVQRTADDLASSALTIEVDVTNDSDRERRAAVSAAVIPPRGAPILVRRTVSVPAHTTRTVAFAPDRYEQLHVANPHIWWPYFLGDQPLYRLRTAVSHGGDVSTLTDGTFGIRTVSSRLIGQSPQAPEGARIFGVNGQEFVFRGGGYSPDLFLRYVKSDIAHQIALIKNLGLTGIRVEGHDMPQDFYDQMDRAGILIIGGFTCCNRWELPADGAGVTERDFRILHDSARAIGQSQRNHPSVINYGWSDNAPIPRQEAEALRAFADVDFDVPIVASAEYKSTPALGQAGEKEGPYDWVPPSFWYDNTHFDPEDGSRTNAGGAWAFGSEQSAGHTVPTLDSLRRFLSEDEQSKLWTQPDYNQYHANFEPGHVGYAFGTLFNFDTALARRYGAWSSLDSYVKLAQVANYENVRAQFEAWIAHSTDPHNPATGVIYWQLNKGWPTLLWSLFNYDGDQPGSFFGAKKANQPLHALFAYDTQTVAVSNFGAAAERGLAVQATVYDLHGRVLDQRSAAGIALARQEVRTGVFALRVPAATVPPARPEVFFVQLVLRQRGAIVDRNVYWISTQQDVVDWPASLGQPQATLSQYADLRALQTLPESAVRVTARTTRDRASATTSVTITNVSTKPVVAFFLRADVRRGSATGAELPGDNQIRTALWNDNDITLWPGESQILTAAYETSELAGSSPVVSLSGWNVDRIVVPAPAER